MAKAGRPKLSDEEKARRKAEREAAKANAPAAADRAEARAANKNSAAPVAAQQASPAEAAKPAQNTDDIDREQAALLKQWVPKIAAARAAATKYAGELRTAYKKAKAEGGFTKADFDTALATVTPEAEARERAKIARQLQIAKWMGSDLGTQFDLFNAPAQMSAVDRARQEGIADSENNKSGGAKPAYDPATPEYAAYMEGFHSFSERRVRAGIKPLHPEVAEDEAKKAAAAAATQAQKDKDAAAFDKPSPGSDNQPAGNANSKPPSDKDAEIPGAPGASPPPAAAEPPKPQSGVPMTRAQFKAAQEAKAAEAAKGN